MNPLARRTGFSLIECVICIVILAIAIPPSILFLDQATSQRVDAIRTMRASFLAASIAETVLADTASTSPGLGFSALSNSAAYLNTPGTGLLARVATITDGSVDGDTTFQVTIGPLVNSSGIVSPTATANVFRRVTVQVSFLRSDGSTQDVSVELFVTDL
jgi:prepilin-type N-terminal cleavage/methylation domain-containing protein